MNFTGQLVVYKPNKNILHIDFQNLKTRLNQEYSGDEHHKSFLFAAIDNYGKDGGLTFI